MITLLLNMTLKCSQCGADMQKNVNQDMGKNLWIAPCIFCLRRANDAGFEEGHDKGWKEAKQEQVV